MPVDIIEEAKKILIERLQNINWDTYLMIFHLILALYHYISGHQLLMN